MPQKPVLAISHKVALSVGGIIRYRVKLHPSHAKNIDKLQFRIRNSAPIYRNITPSSGPWKIAVALVRNPNKLPVVPELVPSIGCAQVCRLDASVDHDTANQDDEGCNEWELEVLSEMILQHNWIDIKVEVYIVPRADSPTPLEANATNNTNNTNDNSRAEGTDAEVPPQVLLPAILSCNYKDTRAICGPALPEDISRAGDEEGLHLVLLTHGIHGSWLDMLYIKEQIDAQNKDIGKTITFLTDTNHAGTEEGIQMAGQRVAMDVLEWTGYCDTEQGQQLRKAFTSKSSTASKTKTAAATATTPIKAFPRGISKVSIIGHSLGGLINVYALGFIEELTQGAFFKTIRPAHFITLATPLLGVGFEHPWVLGYALSLGVIGQTGKDLALENRTSRLKRSASSATSISTSSSSTPTNHTTLAPGLAIECALDKDPEPLLLAMARPGSASNRVLMQFVDRTSYANIENDMAVKFNTSSMMGIPSFDMDHFFSPEGAASQPKKSIYHSAVVSILALLIPQIPPRAKFLGIADAPSPVVIVDHVAAGSVEKPDGTTEFQDASTTAQDNGEEAKKNKKNKKAGSVKSTTSSHRSNSRSISGSGSSSQSSSRSTSPSSSSDVSAKSRLDLALLVSEGYHTGMDWTKIGVFIEHEAHVQIIVRRKWYNLDGWKCVQDLAERFNFS